MTETSHHTLARRLAEQYQQFPQVEAIGLGGSLTSGAALDPISDIDLYVYTTALIPLPERLALVERLGGASQANMNIDYWDLGDEWFDAGTGIEVDAMYWDTRWVEEMLARVLAQHQASIGYSTAHWHTIRASKLLFDRSGWFARLQEWSRQPYPEELRQSIMTRNLAILRDMIPSYLHQIEKAARRSDLVSINHRVAALLASYFDVIFAFNRVLHPGEKRLLEQAARLCARLPENMDQDVTRVLQHSCAAGGELLGAIHCLVGRLEALVQSEP